MEREDSRPSSAAGKKVNRKKHRADSDDDFEARAAYSAYYPVSFNTGGRTPPAYGFSNVVEPQSGRFGTAEYGNPNTMPNYQQYSVPGNNSWPNHGYSAHDGTSNWMQHQQPGYDLSGEFQRMAFQPGPMGTHSVNMQSGYNPAYGQQYSVPQQMWPQHNPYSSGYPPQNGSNYAQGYSSRSPLACNQFQEAQNYPYGQLPSQTFPGRPPSKLEHPLPGSYKSKHFNPQSQSFIPGQVNGTNAPPTTPHGATLSNATYGGGGGYSMPGSLPRQSSTSSQSATFGSPHQAVSTAVPARVPSQPMTHPLPQPVFRRQPSPNVPLPQKPEATPPKSTDRSINGSPAVVSGSMTQNQNSISKWGTPASLPAKPPPSAEPFDPAKFAQASRQQPVGPARVPMPSFGSMPPMVSGYAASAQSVSSPRRI